VTKTEPNKNSPVSDGAAPYGTAANNRRVSKLSMRKVRRLNRPRRQFGQLVLRLEKNGMVTLGDEKLEIQLGQTRKQIRQETDARGARKVPPRTVCLISILFRGPVLDKELASREHPKLKGCPALCRI
jgi:hypothetical protein